MSSGLDLVQRLAAIREQQARRRLADAIAEVREAESGVLNLQQARASVHDSMARAIPGGVDVDAMGGSYTYLATLSKQIAEAENVCNQALEAARQTELDWVAEQHQVKGLDKVIQRRKAQHRQTVERREQRAADDLRKRPRGLGNLEGEL